MKFSSYLWQHTLPIYHAILEHPFNIELANGALSKERFHFYIQQDARYLMDFSKALALIASKAKSTRIMHHFLQFALGALIVERELHAQFLAPDYLHEIVELAPGCMAYCQYLIAMATTASIEEAVAAVLPCFWIYREVGRTIAMNSIQNNPYAKWINTYSSKEFADATDLAISILDEMGSQSSSNMLMLMKDAFECSSFYEWHFWEDSYNMTLFRKAHSTVSSKI